MRITVFCTNAQRQHNGNDYCIYACASMERLTREKKDVDVMFDAV